MVQWNELASAAWTPAANTSAGRARACCRSCSCWSTLTLTAAPVVEPSLWCVVGLVTHSRRRWELIITLGWSACCCCDVAGNVLRRRTLPQLASGCDWSSLRILDRLLICLIAWHVGLYQLPHLQNGGRPGAVARGRQQPWAVPSLFVNLTCMSTPPLYSSIVSRRKQSASVLSLCCMHQSRLEHPIGDSNRFGFPPNGNVRFDCTGCWRLPDKPPIDGLPQLTRKSRSRHTSARHQCGHMTGQWGTHILRGSTLYTAPSQAASPPSHLLGYGNV